MATIESTPENPKTRKPKVDAEVREYIVFGHTSLSNVPQADGTASGIAWAELGRATAAKADEARDTIIDTLPVDEQGGPFVTLAARYWQPESFDIETTTVRKARR